MAEDTDAAEFRRQADAQGIILRAADDEEARFVFDLKAGTIVTSSHAKIARQLLLVAESVYAPDRGEARELARLVARRSALLDEDEGCVVWMPAAKAHASDPGAFRQVDWVAFADWIEDQFLLEDAIAKVDEGVPV